MNRVRFSAANTSIIVLANGIKEIGQRQGQGSCSRAKEEERWSIVARQQPLKSTHEAEIQ